MHAYGIPVVLLTNPSRTDLGPLKTSCKTYLPSTSPAKMHGRRNLHEKCYKFTKTKDKAEETAGAWEAFAFVNMANMP